MTPDSTQSYFDALESDLARAVEIAYEARLRGMGPETHPEIPMTDRLCEFHIDGFLCDTGNKL
ncbi:MAG: hypothetical protein U9N09_04335 [Euryarchaeota archaeon]|nr:hypothetical protein [Euryarchaeota archaeon]